ncbi:MAG: hypothetical protein ABIE92_15920 [bacterium]
MRAYQFVPELLDSCGNYTGMIAYDLDGDGRLVDCQEFSGMEVV